MSRTALAAALAAALALPAYAQTSGTDTDQPADQGASATQDQSGDAGAQPVYITAEMIEEADIVSLEGDYDPQSWDTDQPLQPILAGLERIGEVEEILLDDSGQVQGVTTDVGGFIGIGEKTVMIPLSDLRLARSPEDGTITIVTRLNQEQLEQAPEFQQED
ncbi:PRC-barrel domain-containing protein [Roseivivax isoporae]|uniref:Photosystem reaction center subunit H n=1 Tax=Roseivivax isoporae LMG 25204 TaxID=1449351 RepID=X7FDT1_9RHOB|nr:PRC-barrel domain-containing protein [Roseivivax isoporae]ETX30923.1 photosystem reaction center subunit H [Roseivivax isoporae LMG 25204]